MCSDLRHGERDEAKWLRHEQLFQILSVFRLLATTKHAHCKTTSLSYAMRRRNCAGHHLQQIGSSTTTPSPGRAGNLPASAAEECAAQLLAMHAAHYVERLTSAMVGARNYFGDRGPTPMGVSDFKRQIYRYTV